MSYQRCSTRYAVTVSMPRSPTDTFKVIIDYWSAPSGNSRHPLHVTLPNLCIPVARRMAASATSWELRAGASDSSCASLLEHCSGAIDHSVGRMRFRGFTAVVMGHTNHQACAPDQSRPDAL
jgi:hypothetical protein